MARRSLFVHLLIKLSITVGLSLASTSFEMSNRDIFWGLTDANKTRTCILLTGVFELAVHYDTLYFMKDIAMIPVPRQATVNGFCQSDLDPNVQEMTLTWNPDPLDPSVQHNLTFVFIQKSRNNGEGYYYELGAIHAEIKTNSFEFPDAADTEGVYDLTASTARNAWLSAPLGQSYECRTTQLIFFDGKRGRGDAIGMTMVHAEAFHDKIALGDGTDFGPKLFCSKDGFEVMLMVASYVTLLGLIGFGIFYLIDRRRKRKEYEYL